MSQLSLHEDSLEISNQGRGKKSQLFSHARMSQNPANIVHFFSTMKHLLLHERDKLSSVPKLPKISHTRGPRFMMPVATIKKHKEEQSPESKS